jgi:hypothetical protein
MKKIIILSDTDEPRYGLISHLKQLFPECEIQIFPRRFENIEEDMITATKGFSLNKSGKTIA